MSHRLTFLAAVTASVVSIAGCDMTSRTVDGSPAAETPAPTAPLTPDGAPTSLVLSSDNTLQWAASVVELDILPDQNAKLFGTAGGDPAMNGLQTFIAFFISPGDGWAVYPIGDILGYTVLSTAPGRVDLEISESTLEQATGTIGSRTRRLIVRWTGVVDGGAPTTVTVTRAQ